MKHLSLLLVLILFISCANDDNEVNQQQMLKEKYSLNVLLNPSSSGIVNISSGEYEEGTEVEIIVTPNTDFEFKDWTGDISGNQNPLKVIMNSNKSITGNLRQLEIQSIEIINPIDTLVISRKHKFEVIGINSKGTNVDLTSQVVLKVNDDKITLLDDNEFTVGKSGDTSITVIYDNLELTHTFYANYFEEVLDEQGYYLNNNDNSNINVPIVIINYHPTLDGFNVDPRRIIDDYFIKDRFYDYYNLDRNICSNTNSNNPICKIGTLEMYKIRSKENIMFTKFGIEEGSKFRGYNNNSSEKSINVQIVKYYNFYQLNTKVYSGREVPQPDYQEIFDLINLESLVNENGVKEVWFSFSPLSTEYPSIQQGLISSEFLLNMPESNMSSSLGDVSNSIRSQSDLPVYENEYVVYGLNLDRGPSESLHNRGHQIESQFRFIEKEKRFGEELFWNKFVGVDESGKPLGRNGMTHFPPNTNVDYDYCNENLVESDIQNWLPEGGEKDLVSCVTWTGIQYDYPFNSIFWGKDNKIDNISKDSGYKWFIYWFQSIPGQNNNISYEKDGSEYKLTNWWNLYYNWNESLENNKTLWE